LNQRQDYANIDNINKTKGYASLRVEILSAWLSGLTGEPGRKDSKAMHFLFSFQ
jgi:hypothetical protein